MKIVKITLIARLPDDFIEEQIDNSLADIIFSAGGEVLDSLPYKIIKEKRRIKMKTVKDTNIGEAIVFEVPQKQVYVFKDGTTITLKDVTELVVRPSGDHRLTTADGMRHIVGIRCGIGIKQ